MYDEEQWYDVEGYPNYRTTDYGVVQNKRTGRILKHCDNNSGYPTVNLYNNGNRTTKGIHRLVAEMFVDGYDDGLEVNHKDGDKHNNYKDNLEWVTRGANESHAYETGLKYGPKHRPVRIKETGEVFPSIKDCARAIDGNDTNIRQCLHGYSKSHLGLTYEYADGDDININSRSKTKAADVAKRKPYRRSVRVVETGEVFPSVRSCANAIGGDQGTISGCLSGKHHTHHGYHYEYAD